MTTPLRRRLASAAAAAALTLAALVAAPGAATATEITPYGAAGPCDQQASGVRTWWNGSTLYAQNCNTSWKWMRSINENRGMKLYGPCSYMGPGQVMTIQSTGGWNAYGWSSC